MESSTHSTFSEDTLYSKGFLKIEDTELEQDLSLMRAKGFPFGTEEGLDFCIRHVLGNKQIRSVIESWFGERCVLAHWLRYTAHPGHAICFRGGGLKAGRRRLMIHLLAKNSKVGYYVRSHLENLPTEETEYLFYEVPQAALDKAGLQIEDIDNGGIVIFDARLCLELKEGYAISFLFATEDVVTIWPPMFLPNSQELLNKVRNEMESHTIGVNFAVGDRAKRASHEPPKAMPWERRQSPDSTQDPAT